MRKRIFELEVSVFELQQQVGHLLFCSVRRLRKTNVSFIPLLGAESSSRRTVRDAQAKTFRSGAAVFIPHTGIHGTRY